MDFKQLQRIVRQGESQQVEFKQNLNHPEQVLEEVVGFANATGGHLFIGVSDRGEVPGLRYAEDDLAYLEALIRERIQPEPEFTTALIAVTTDRAVIHLQIAEGPAKPYGYVPAGQRHRRVLYRVGDHCLQASRELKNIMRGRHRQRIISYTGLERAVLQALHSGEALSKREIADQVPFSARQVSDCLVRLVLAGVVDIRPARGGDVFALRDPQQAES